MTNALDLDSDNRLAEIVRVETGSAWAEAVDSERLTRVGVGSLVAIQSANAFEYLIGILDRVTRDAIEDDAPDDETSMSAPILRDLLRVVLVGTYRVAQGTGGPGFKRGADAYPRIGASCWELIGSNCSTS